MKWTTTTNTATISLTIGPDPWRYTVRRITRGQHRDEWRAHVEDRVGYIEPLGTFPDEDQAMAGCLVHARKRRDIANHFAPLPIVK